LNSNGVILKSYGFGFVILLQQSVKVFKGY